MPRKRTHHGTWRLWLALLAAMVLFSLLGSSRAPRGPHLPLLAIPASANR